ncbi:MAG: hyi [Anaerosporomusa subterranea]|jgi:hydroxypyruvate isomerase|nr:hyi [Anaerosporomusa subterranea]
MPHFAANLTMSFQEIPFMQRFAAASQAGFDSVEFMFPYDYTKAELRQALDANSLKIVLFNLPAGNWAQGDRGVAVHPERKQEFRDGVEKALSYAEPLGVKQLNCLVGKKLTEFSDAEQRATLIENLRCAAEKLAEKGIRLLVEPLNSFDMPGFYHSTAEQVLTLLDEVGHANAYLQYDLYHEQRGVGELTATLRKQFARIAHIQIADNPGRHQPGTGELNYRFLFSEIDRLGYTGYVGLEYIPEGPTADSFSWVEEYGYTRK